MQIKNTMKYDHTPVRMAITNWQGCRGEGTLSTAGKNINWYNYYGSSSKLLLCVP